MSTLKSTRRSRSIWTLILSVIALAVGLVVAQASAGAASTCQGQTATIVGTAGDDTLTGGPGNDVVALLSGDDFFDGQGGNDVVCGDSGADFLVGGAGDDTLDGGSGNDQVRGDFFSAAGDAAGDGGNDTLIGGPGGDDRAAGDNFAPNGNASGNGGDDFITEAERTTARQPRRRALCR